MSALDAKDAAGQKAAAPPQARARSNPVLALTRLLGALCWTVFCHLGYSVARWRRRGAKAKRCAAVKWSQRLVRGLLRIAGIEVHRHGRLPSPPALITPNHLGYLDILALEVVCGMFFVAKAEALSWPIIGYIFRHAEHIGVSRGHVRSVRDANAKVVERLQQGFAVCVFLEGTSSGGREVLPFHASLIQPAIDVQAPVVPAAVRWCAADPAVDIVEDVAYWQDHTIATHAWRVLGLKGLRADIVFGEPLSPAGRDRKELAREARLRVIRLLDESRGTPTDAQEDTAARLH